MPRDSGGTYTLPVSNPVTSGTIITSTWANATMPDLGSALTDSLSRTGNGAMQAALKHVDGSMGTPSQTFNNEPTSGRYRAGTNDVRESIAGVDKTRVNADGLSVMLEGGWHPVNPPDAKAGRKNYFFNGDFNVWENTITVNFLGVAGHFADRWFIDGRGTNDFTVTQVQKASGLAYFGGGAARIVLNAPFDLTRDTFYAQRVEDVEQSHSRTFTFTIYHSSTVAMAFNARLVQYAGNSGSGIIETPIGQLNSSPSLARETLTFDAPSVAALTIGSDSWFSIELEPLTVVGIGSSYTVEQTQLEVGGVATAFEYRPIAEEERLCSRYFQNVVAPPQAAFVGIAHGHAVGPTIGVITVPITPMRAPPTIILSSPAHFSMSGVSGADNACTAISLNGTVSYRGSIRVRGDTAGGLAVGNATGMRTLNSAARLAFLAEL